MWYGSVVWIGWICCCRKIDGSPVYWDSADTVYGRNREILAELAEKQMKRHRVWRDGVEEEGKSEEEEEEGGEEGEEEKSGDRICIERCRRAQAIEWISDRSGCRLYITQPEYT